MSDQGSARIPPMSLEGKRQSNVAGIVAVIVGLLGVFTVGFIFGPLGIIVSIVALAKRQIALGMIGLILSVVACVTSVPLMTLVGLGALFTLF